MSMGGHPGPCELKTLAGGTGIPFVLSDPSADTLSENESLGVVPDTPQPYANRGIQRFGTPRGPISLVNDAKCLKTH